MSKPIVSQVKSWIVHNTEFKLWFNSENHVTALEFILADGQTFYLVPSINMAETLQSISSEILNGLV